MMLKHFPPTFPLNLLLKVSKPPPSQTTLRYSHSSIPKPTNAVTLPPSVRYLLSNVGDFGRDKMGPCDNATGRCVPFNIKNYKGRWGEVIKHASTTGRAERRNLAVGLWGLLGGGGEDGRFYRYNKELGEGIRVYGSKLVGGYMRDGGGKGVGGGGGVRGLNLLIQGLNKGNVREGWVEVGGRIDWDVVGREGTGRDIAGVLWGLGRNLEGVEGAGIGDMLEGKGGRKLENGNRQSISMAVWGLARLNTGHSFVNSILMKPEVREKLRAPRMKRETQGGEK